ATIWVLNTSGASLVVTDNPTGESSSSATVNTNRMPIMASNGVEFAAPSANGRNRRNANPMMMVPAANLIGVDGCFGPHLVQTAANTPDRRMMKIGLIDCTQ